MTALTKSMHRINSCQQERPDEFQWAELVAVALWCAAGACVLFGVGYLGWWIGGHAGEVTRLALAGGAGGF